MSRMARLVRKLPPLLFEFARELDAAGFACFLVGGAVRSLISGTQPNDFDIATDALPADVMKVFRRVVPTGIRHGTVTVLYRGLSIEVTTFRSEADYSDGRHPDSVEFVGDIDTDLARRDFTMNAIAIDLRSRELFDPHNGQADIANHLIRAIGNPETRLQEDALRVLRAVRFAARLEFVVAPATLAAVRSQREGLRKVSIERIREELEKLLLAERPSTGLRLMDETGLIPIVLPELGEGVGVEQRGDHIYDVFTHALLACDAAPRGNLVLRLAALLHDVGKPRCLAPNKLGENTFHGHDSESARMVEEILRRVRFPTATQHAVAHLVRNHMFTYTPEWTDAAVRRFIARVGEYQIDQLFELRRADTYALRGEWHDTRGLDAFKLRIADVLSRDHALSRGDLAVDGDDLAARGIPRGPAMGTTIDYLLETVLDDPSQNTRDQLLQIAVRFYEDRVRSPESFS